MIQNRRVGNYKSLERKGGMLDDVILWADRFEYREK